MNKKENIQSETLSLLNESKILKPIYIEINISYVDTDYLICFLRVFSCLSQN